MKRVLVWFAASISITVISFFLLRKMVEWQGIELSIHGEIAMAIGVFFTFALGTALMALIFYSNKHGHDEKVHHSTSDPNHNSQ